MRNVRRKTVWDQLIPHCLKNRTEDHFHFSSVTHNIVLSNSNNRRYLKQKVINIAKEVLEVFILLNRSQMKFHMACHKCLANFKMGNSILHDWNTCKPLWWTRIPPRLALYLWTLVWKSSKKYSHLSRLILNPHSN